MGFTTVFVAEMLLKMIAFGLFWGPDTGDQPPYFRSSWNVLIDAPVVPRRDILQPQGSRPNNIKLYSKSLKFGLPKIIDRRKSRPNRRPTRQLILVLFAADIFSESPVFISGA